MLQDVVVEMMPADWALWRCLHSGPLNRDNVDQPAPLADVPWDQCRARNAPLLAKLAAVYGGYAVVCRDGDNVVGQLRFYPKAVLAMEGAGYMCMQQLHPAGPANDFADADFPPPDQLDDRTIVVNCMMTGRHQRKDDPYQRKGLAKRMVRWLVDWARANGWQAIEADALEDLSLFYEASGQADRSFWEKLGFRCVATRIDPELEKESDFVTAARKEAAARGIDPDRIKNIYTMRLDLSGQAG